MARNKAIEERVKALVAEMLAEEKAEGRVRNINDIEDAMVRIGTSSPMESTIKQINRRIKGTEKFWSEGADPMLHLVADRLSQTNVIDKFWSRRLDRLIQSASYQLAT